NYVFTEDSVRRAYSLLTDNGDVLLYNYYRRWWLVEKFQQMMLRASGKAPLLVHEQGDFKMLLAGKVRAADTEPRKSGVRIDIPTDDWPFPYLIRRGIPVFYGVAMVAAVLVTTGLMLLLHFANRRRGGAGGAGGTGTPAGLGLMTKGAFVLMGTAFLLLETKSIVQFSLLFGTTWLNTSLVFLAVLALVLAANWTATAAPLRKPSAIYVIYGLLLASCLVTFLFPLSRLLAFESRAARFVVASLMTFSPIYFANLIFSLTFRDEEVPEHLFGWNLLGATVGGIV